MTVAARPCPEPSCANLMPCPDHRKVAWADSNRKSRLANRSGRREQRRARAVILKHRGVCHICGNPGATIADHVVALADGGADDEANMRPAHPVCHKRKTAQEAARGRARAK